MHASEPRSPSAPSPTPQRRSALLLMGPTGAGKSDIALRLAERFPFEIVSVDSAQVYRGMDIGTAKPDRRTRERIAHHLIDIRDPAMNYSAGEFVRDAAQAMAEIWARGRQPLLVGGTMLYFHALTAGLAELPTADARLREEIESQAAVQGWTALHAELARVDPEAAARIHANDPQRIQRALEVYRATGLPITRLQHRRASALDGVQVLELVLAPRDRGDLHRRIAQRFEAMLAAGFLSEVRTLYERTDLTAEHPSMRAVGYRQAWMFLAGRCGLDEAKEKAVVATRQLAKRQLTWLRQRRGSTWLDSMHPHAASKAASALSECRFAGWT